MCILTHPIHTLPAVLPRVLIAHIRATHIRAWVFRRILAPAIHTPIWAAYLGICAHAIITLALAERISCAAARASHCCTRVALTHSVLAPLRAIRLRINALPLPALSGMVFHIPFTVIITNNPLTRIRRNLIIFLHILADFLSLALPCLALKLAKFLPLPRAISIPVCHVHTVLAPPPRRAFLHRLCLFSFLAEAFYAPFFPIHPRSYIKPALRVHNFYPVIFLCPDVLVLAVKLYFLRYVRKCRLIKMRNRNLGIGVLLHKQIYGCAASCDFLGGFELVYTSRNKD